MPITADRILVHGLHALAFETDWSQRQWFVKESLADVIRTDLANLPLIRADNVADYARAHGANTLEDFPSLAPPWPAFWIEYPSSTGRQRRGVLCVDRTGDDSELIRNAFTDAGSSAEVRWVLQLTVVIDDMRKVGGPVGSFVLVLDRRGRCVGNRWTLHPSVDEHFLLAACQPALQTIAFMHCRNVAVDVERPDVKLSRAHQKRKGRPLVCFRTLRLQLPRRASGTRLGLGAGESPAFHDVPGHFAHYGDCCPGLHDMKGLLFGKLEGIYWIPDHVRGNPERGVNVNDYEIVL